MDFKFLQNPLSKNWVVLAPRRKYRPDEAKEEISFCPFCPGREENEPEVYRVGGESGDSNWPASNASQSDAGWQIRVISNKFPFAPIHEIVIHSQDHHKNFEELPLSQVELIFKTYKQRFNTHKDKGQVYIFHNHGERAGESLPHPHTQIAVIPNEVSLDMPHLSIEEEVEEVAKDQVALETSLLELFCPKSSQWPDEVWIHPKRSGTYFGEITDEEISDLAKATVKLIKILSSRHGAEFPYNFYIYPGKDWYLRLIPRDKSLGGFEIGTGIFVNTQDPQDCIGFIKENF